VQILANFIFLVVRDNLHTDLFFFDPKGHETTYVLDPKAQDNKKKKKKKKKSPLAVEKHSIVATLQYVRLNG
jgi:hypothetical protein